MNEIDDGSRRSGCISKSVKRTFKNANCSGTADFDLGTYVRVGFYRIGHLYLPVHRNKSRRTVCADLGLYFP